jgi:hypothetical protein
LRRGKRKTPCCRTGCRHTPNAPDPTLDCGGVPWYISDTTDKSIKLTDFDAESTEPSCMPLIYWSTQNTATINLLRPEHSTNTLYLPYTVLLMPLLQLSNHHHVTTNAPTQLDDIMQATITDNNTQFDTQFDKIIAKLEIDNIIQHAVKRQHSGIINYLRTMGNYFVLLSWRLFY